MLKKSDIENKIIFNNLKYNILQEYNFDRG
jgi:hypothetical protein